MLDPGTFKEIGSIAGKASYDAKGNITGFMPGNCVFGRGTVDGRPVVIAGDDFTLRGGSADASIKGKPKMSEEIATQFRMPIIRLIEGSGGGGSVKTIETTGRANLPGGPDRNDIVRPRRQPDGAGAGGRPGPWVGRRPRRRAPGGLALLGHGQGDRRGVRRRPARWWNGSANRAPNRNSAAGRSSCAAAPSTTPSTPRKRRSKPPAGSCPTCPARSTTCRRACAAGTIRTGATSR